MTAHEGILGGNFDPVHNGHLAIARHCHSTLTLGCIRLIPLGMPAHRPPPLAGAGDRMAMLQLACSTEPGLMADDIEIVRSGTSYTIDTLDELRHRNPGTTFYFITGQDAFLSINTWKDWRHLFDLAHFIILNRTNDKITVHADVQEELEKRECPDIKRVKEKQSGKIIQLQIPPIEISSSMVRQYILEEKSLDGLVPEQVKHYITEKGLYRT